MKSFRVIAALIALAGFNQVHAQVAAPPYRSGNVTPNATGTITLDSGGGDVSDPANHAIHVECANAACSADRYARVAPLLGGFAAAFTGSVGNTATLVSASPQYLTAAQFTQFNASVGCLSLYDASSAGSVTLGTTMPIGSWCATGTRDLTVPLPTGEGLNFNNGIVAACVGAYNGNSSPGSTACSYNLVSSFPQSRYQVVSNPLVFANTPMTNAFGCQGQFTAGACISATTLNPTSAPVSSLGSSIAPLNLPLIWNVGPTAKPGNAGTGGGLADLVTDQGFYTSSGKHSLYATVAVNNLGGACGANCWLYSAASPVNPFSYDGAGDLIIASGYDSANSAWYTGEINSQSFYKYQTDGYATPASGFYYEVQFNASGPPAGFCPWSATWIKNNQVYDAYFGTDWNSYHPAIEIDNLEMCLQGPVTSAQFPDYSHPAQSKHEFGSQNTVPGQLSGLSNQRVAQNAKGTFTFNPYDGQDHFAGILVTPNWYVMFLDRREIYRVAKTGMEEEQVGYVLKFTGGKGFAAPTASSSMTWAMTVKGMWVYACTPKVGCPVN